MGSRRLSLLRRGAASVDFSWLDDRECARPLFSLSASTFVGDLSVLGIASSSIVLPRGLEGGVVSVRLRIVMPWRCRSLRFCPRC